MRRLLLTLGLAFGASVAQADNGLIYAGAGIVRDDLRDVTAGSVSSDIKSTSWKAYAGVRPISLFAIEADYTDLGSNSGTFFTQAGTCPVGGCPVTVHTDAKAFAGYAVGFLPIPVPFLDVFGKAGLARWQLHDSQSGGAPCDPAACPLFALSKNGTEFAWGGGAQVHVGNLGARLEYENFRIPNTNGADVVSLEVFFNLF